MGNDLPELFGLALRESLRDRPKTTRRVTMATVIGVSDEGTALVEFDGDEGGGQHEVTPLARVLEGSRVLVDFTPGGGAYILGTPGGTDAPAGRIAYAEATNQLDCLQGATTTVLTTTFNTNEARLLRMEGQVSGLMVTNPNHVIARITLGPTAGGVGVQDRRIGEADLASALTVPPYAVNTGEYATFFGGLWMTSLIGDQQAQLRVTVNPGAAAAFRLNANYVRFIAVIDYGRA